VAEAVDVEPRPEIVFVTAFEHYAPDAFHVDAADYLLKPVRFETHPSRCRGGRLSRGR